MVTGFKFRLTNLNSSTLTGKEILKPMCLSFIKIFTWGQTEKERERDRSSNVLLCSKWPKCLRLGRLKLEAWNSIQVLCPGNRAMYWGQWMWAVSWIRNRSTKIWSSSPNQHDSGASQWAKTLASFLPVMIASFCYVRLCHIDYELIYGVVAQPYSSQHGPILYLAGQTNGWAELIPGRLIGCFCGLYP